MYPKMNLLFYSLDEEFEFPVFSGHHRHGENKIKISYLEQIVANSNRFYSYFNVSFPRCLSMLIE